jgi:hypothetical protein
MRVRPAGGAVVGCPSVPKLRAGAASSYPGRALAPSSLPIPVTASENARFFSLGPPRTTCFSGANQSRPAASRRAFSEIYRPMAPGGVAIQVATRISEDARGIAAAPLTRIFGRTRRAFSEEPDAHFRKWRVDRIRSASVAHQLQANRQDRLARFWMISRLLSSGSR